MFKVNKMTDYATVILIEMARTGAVESTQRIAAHTGIPLPTVAKILKSLVRADLVASHRGVTGGYALGRPAADISVADVIQAIEGPVRVTACSSDEAACEQYAKCNVRDPLARVRERILAALGECTVAELAADVPRIPTTQAAVLHTYV